MYILEELKNINLVIVSKNQPKEAILQYYNRGYRDFGENKAQELLTKTDLPDDINWHFIGHLQTNKVKQIIPHVKMIQSVDSLNLAIEINKQASKINKIIDVLIEFNLSKEKSKYGLSKEEAFLFINRCSMLKNISIRGIMVMGPNSEDINQIKAVFKEAKQLFDKLKEKYPSMDTLSMGMSADYKIAIEEGSTMVRIGSLLF